MNWLGLLILLTVVRLAHSLEDTCGETCGLRAVPSVYRPMTNSYGNVVYGMTRVVGGTGSRPGSWPWLVSIQHPWVPGLKHICGGSLISTNWVLTAAHCFDQIKEISMVYVVIGATHLTQSSPGTQVRHIKQVLIHQYYNSDDLSNDIALMELDHPVQCGPYIQLACVADRTVKVSKFNNCWIAGWGVTTARSLGASDHLQEAKVHLIDLQLCNSSHWHAGKIRTHNLCAGYPEGNIGSCQGDSGGPLMCQEKNSGQWWVIGITSWGRGCARARLPGVYISTQYFYDWILFLMNLSTDENSPMEVPPTSRACSNFLTTSHLWSHFISISQPPQKLWPGPIPSLKATLDEVNSCPFPIKILVEFFTRVKELLQLISGQNTS